MLITLANRETAMPGVEAIRRRDASRRPIARVIVEIFVLALASTIRPTSLAAVYTLVSHDGRRRLMWAYVVAGLAFTVAFGAVIVGATHGIHLGSGTNKTKGIADIAGGIVALAFGVGLRHRPRRRRRCG